MSTLEDKQSNMQMKLVAHAKCAATLRLAADAIERQNIYPELVAYLREHADAADGLVAHLEHSIADVTTRLAILSTGLPDPGVGRARFQ